MNDKKRKQCRDIEIDCVCACVYVCVVMCVREWLCVCVLRQRLRQRQRQNGIFMHGTDSGMPEEVEIPAPVSAIAC